MSSSTSLAQLAAAYPHIAHALGPVTELIKKMERRKTPAYCQLEARLGVIRPEGDSSFFQSGVDAAFVSRTLCRLKTSDAFTVLPWTEQMDRFYLLPSGLQVRTTTETVNGPTEITGAVTHMIKTSLGHVDLKWQANAPAALHASEDGDLLNVRVSLKQEEPSFEDELQDRVDDMHVVRLKQRECFLYSSSCAEHLVWEFGVTQLYQAQKDEDAVAQLKAGLITQYELNVRCREPMEHLKNMGGDHARLAASLLLKAADFFQVDGGPPLAATSNTLVVC
jgi:hypothetical protein